jgi:transposase-like protein/IS1 family transposase
MTMNLAKLVESFHSEDKCRTYLEKLRWPDGIQCPRCSSKSISKVNRRKIHDCNECRYQFSVTTGTIFHDTHLPLWKWFLVIYMMGESKKGVSANQIKRSIDVSYKTAWYLCHRIRKALKDAETGKLDGIVEVDETYIGGKRKGVGSGNRADKTLIVGAMEREGEIRIKVIEKNDRKTLHRFIKKHTKPETEMIITDEWPAYIGIKNHYTDHKTVNHRLEEWVRGEIHTNGIENVWSLLKRSIVGAYHNVSAKHLNAYLDELEFRFNNRDNPYLFRDTLRKLISSDNLEYKELVA